MPGRQPVGFDHSLRIDCSPAKVLAAFFDSRALTAWWEVEQSVTAARPFGVYALQWPPSPEVDDLLGRLGGVYHGTVIDFHPDRGFFVADSYYLPPDSDPIGPMALEVTCTPAPAQAGHGSVVRGTLVRVVQSGLDDSPRWRRYYELIAAGWPRALEGMKQYLEHGQGVWDLRRYE